MAVTIRTVGGLRSALNSWLGGRTDFNASADDLITLAEDKINLDLVERVFMTTTPLVAVVSSRFIALPTDYLTPESLMLTTYGDERELRQYVAGADELTTVNAAPRAWAINNTNIELDAPADVAHTFRFRYRQKFALDLTNSGATNWLLTNFSGAYLYGALAQVNAFTGDGDDFAGWAGMYANIIDGLKTLEAQQYAGVTLQQDDALLAGAGGLTGFSILTGR